MHSARGRAVYKRYVPTRHDLCNTYGLPYCVIFEELPVMYMYMYMYIHECIHVQCLSCIQCSNMQIEILYSSYCANHPKAVAVLTDNSYVQVHVQFVLYVHVHLYIHVYTCTLVFNHVHVRTAILMACLVPNMYMYMYTLCICTIDAKASPRGTYPMYHSQTRYG